MVERLLREKLDIPAEVKSAWVRGKEVVARLISLKYKEKVMRNKSKLASSKIFIENFRNFDERKRQDEINAWVREKKEHGIQLKAGFGKIFYNNVWYKWEDRVTLEERMRVEENREGHQNDVEGEGANF